MADQSQALGLIETRGLVAAIEAADAMLKAANVTLLGKEVTKGALITIKVEGETGAVKSSVAAGAAAAQRVGEVVSTHIIPRPHDELGIILSDSDAPPGGSTWRGPPPPLAELQSMPVRQLRDLARQTPQFGLQGRDISHANKEQLLEQFLLIA